MIKISCEQCGKEFKKKAGYTQHQKIKTPCVNKSSFKKFIFKKFIDMLDKLEDKLNISLSCSSTEIDPTTANITIDTSTFIELKKYYDEILNTDKSTYKSSNDEPTPIDCITEMISKIPNELWEKRIYLY